MSLERFSETVIFRIPVYGLVDDYGKPITSYEDIEVKKCLVSPASTEDVTGTFRIYDYSKVDIFITKDFTRSLSNAKAIVRGKELKVIGDPFSINNSPLDWNRKVICEVYSNG